MLSLKREEVMSLRRFKKVKTMPKMSFTDNEEAK